VQEGGRGGGERREEGQEEGEGEWTRERVTSTTFALFSGNSGNKFNSSIHFRTQNLETREFFGTPEFFSGFFVSVEPAFRLFSEVVSFFGEAIVNTDTWVTVVP
jgi:hypothetical protein